MPKHELDGETPTSPANKRVRFDFVAEKQQEHQLVDLCRIAAQEVAEPAGQTVAWSKHNLLAKIVSSPPAHIAFSLVPLSKKGKQSCPPFSIALPLASDEDAHYLSFSPAGSHLLLAVGAPNRLRLLLYQIASSGCINDWEIAQEWNLPIQQEYPAKVSSLQWLSEDRQTEFQEDTFARRKQAGCSVLQAGGQAFAAVLNSNEVILGRFASSDAGSTAPCLLRLSLNGVAGSQSPAEASTSTNNIPTVTDPSPTPSTALGLSMGLPASQEASPSTERITHSAITCLEEESALLIATSSIPLPIVPDTPIKAEVQEPKNDQFDTEMSLDDEFMLAFGGISSTNLSDSRSPEASLRSLDPLAQISGHVEKKINMRKVSIRWQPRSLHFEISLQQLDPVWYPNENQPQFDRLLSMSWLSKVSAAPQLVLATTDGDCQKSLLQNFNLLLQPFMLSEVFSTMDCKKADVRQGSLCWIASNLISESVQEGIITQLQPGPLYHQSSVLGLVHHEEWSSVSLFTTALKLALIGRSQKLNLDTWPTAYTVSPNSTIMSVTGHPEESDASLCCNLPEVPTSPEFFGQRLALGLVQRNDLSDVVRCVPRDDAAAVFSQVQATLKTALPKKVNLEQSPLVFDLLRIQHLLRVNRTKNAVFSSLLGQLMACVEVFQTSTIKTRAAEGGGPTLFHRDSIWPLMGYTSFYCTSVRQIVTAVTQHDPQTSKQWPAEMLFLLHSPAVAVLRQLCQFAIKFHSFIFAFEAPAGTVAVEIARSVIDEITTSSRSGINLRQWAEFLEELPKKIDGIVDENMKNHLFAEAAPPEDPKEPLSTLMHDVWESVKPLADPSAPVNNSDSSWDIITRARLPRDKPIYRRCTRCDSVSDVSNGKLPEDRSGFYVFCMSWKAQCICGGKWRLNKVAEKS